MFIGKYYHTLEAKGRLAIPVRFRRNLKKGSVVTRGLEGCLFLFPLEEWKKLIGKLRQSPLTRRDARAFVRLIVNAASEVTFDRQGRMSLPRFLRDYAGLVKEIVVAGSLNRIEIWDKERYHTYMESVEGKSEELAERLADLDI